MDARGDFVGQHRVARQNLRWRVGKLRSPELIGRRPADRARGMIGQGRVGQAASAHQIIDASPHGRDPVAE